MADILKGAPVAEAILARCIEKREMLEARDIHPALAVLRVGERPDDLSYERGIIKRCEKTGIAMRQVILPEDVTQEGYEEALLALNEDPGIHGILAFRPLPKTLDDGRVPALLSPEKDVDGCTKDSLAGVFMNRKTGFPPCTAEAVMEILSFYGIDPAGKKACVIGRSLVIGRPVAMLLMHAQATIAICHTRTKDAAAIAREADILVVAARKMEMTGADYIRPGQTVIDVGIHWNEERGSLCGDVRFAEAEPLAGAITPVPGGVGSVTTAVLLEHVVTAAERAAE